MIHPIVLYYRLPKMTPVWHWRTATTRWIIGAGWSSVKVPVLDSKLRRRMELRLWRELSPPCRLRTDVWLPQRACIRI